MRGLMSKMGGLMIGWVNCGDYGWMGILMSG